MVDIEKDAVYVPSDNIVAREIEGELIIVPLIAGIGDLEDELFTLNETGRVIWSALDGKSTLKDIIERLTEAYDSESGEIEQDVMGLVEELVRRGMLVEQTKD